MRKTITATITAATVALTACTANSEPVDVRDHTPTLSSLSSTTAAPQPAEQGPKPADFGEEYNMPEGWFGDGTVDVTVHTIDVTTECDGVANSIERPDPGNVYLTITGEVASVDGNRAPNLTFFDTSGYELPANLAWCDEPDDTIEWMSADIQPGKRARLSSTYQIGGDVAEVWVGDRSFVLDRMKEQA